MRLYSILVLLCVFLFSGCSWIQFPSIHKVTVQQGNIVSQEMVDKLQIGMTKTQVQYILGTATNRSIPLIHHAGIIITLELIPTIIKPNSN